MSHEQFKFSHRLRVRWGEVDMQGIVFNANYLLYFDVGITEYWRELGKTMPELHEIFLIHSYVVKSTLDFHSPARFDDEIDVLVRTSRLGSSSMKVAFEIHRDAVDGKTEPLISGESIYVFAPQSKPAAMPPRVRALIQAYESIAPDQ
jgi:acyl-CoA thioester hydrolase